MRRNPEAPPVNLSGPAARVWTVAFSPDGTRLAAGSSDQNIYLWRTARDTMRLARTWRGQGAEVRALAFTPNGRFLVTGDRDGKVMLWDSQAPSKELAITNVFASYSNPPPVFSPNGELVAAMSAPDEIWGLESAHTRRVQRFRESLVPLAFSADGKALKTFSADGSFRIRRLDHGEASRTARFHRTNRFHVATLGMDGRTLAAGYFDGSFSVWDTDTETRIMVLRRT
jgi:WD40 repeat protein